MNRDPGLAVMATVANGATTIVLATKESHQKRRNFSVVHVRSNCSPTILEVLAPPCVLKLFILTVFTR